MFHMFGVDVGDNGHSRGQTVKGAVTFIRFDHHPFTLAHPGVRAIGMDDATIHNRRIKIPCIQQRCYHGCGRGFAVGAGHRNIGFEAHQFGQHFGPAHHRKAPTAGFV